MNENFLHFVWQHKCFDFLSAPFANTSDTLQIINTGMLNTDAGPDFTNAKIKINKTVWVGNVEVHVKSSDWYRHAHQNDALYRNIILHVVYEHDAEIYDDCGQTIPCLALKGLIPDSVFERFNLLMLSSDTLSCSKVFQQIKTPVVVAQFEKALVERIMEKGEYWQNWLRHYHNNWSEVFYIAIAAAFGAKVNAAAFEQLARSLPLQLLAKNKFNLRSIEALLFGVSGLLQTPARSAYQSALQAEFKFLKQKYKLQEMDPAQWKFLRMRPASFPTIRISQFAALIFNASQLLSKVLEQAFDVDALRVLFKQSAHEFWDNHFHFNKASDWQQCKTMGDEAIEGVLINAVVPCLYLYGQYLGEQKYCDAALHILHQLPAEKNKKTKLFSSAAYTIRSAFDSQACIAQYNLYCSQKQCARCSIGYAILKI